MPGVDIDVADLFSPTGLTILALAKDSSANSMSYMSGYSYTSLVTASCWNLFNASSNPDLIVPFTVLATSALGGAFAAAAAENHQETIWWQLSCFASADLPSISSLNLEQQQLFSVVVSSDANTESPAYVEGKIMQKFFVGLADNFRQIDANGDDMITAGEMSDAIPNRKIFSLRKKSLYSFAVPSNGASEKMFKYSNRIGRMRSNVPLSIIYPH